MKTVLENINDVEKLVKVSFEWNEVKDDYIKLCNKLRKDFRLDGFRPGKVPMSLAKKHLAPRIEYEFVNSVIEKTFEEAIKSEGIKDYIDSSLQDMNFEENKDFTYDIKIEVDPEISLPKYKDGFTIKKKIHVIEDNDVEKYLESVKKERAEIINIDGKVENGHFVTCDLMKDGEETTQEDVQWQVGEKPLAGDAEKAILDLNNGDKFSTELMIDDNTAKYDITIKSIQKHIYPEINDEWVKKNMETVESLGVWKQQIKDSMVKELNDKTKFEFETNIKNWFKENMDLTIPKSRVENYLEGMVKQFNQQQGGNANVPAEEIKKYYTPQAEDSVRWFLVEEKIKEEEGISVTSEDYDAKVEEMLSQYPEDQREQFKSIFEQDNYKKQLELQILSEKIFEHVKEFVTEDVEEIKTSEMTK